MVLFGAEREKPRRMAKAKEGAGSRRDYLYTAPDGKHAASSRNGCLVLVITPERIEVLS